MSDERKMRLNHDRLNVNGSSPLSGEVKSVSFSVKSKYLHFHKFCKVFNSTISSFVKCWRVHIGDVEAGAQFGGPELLHDEGGHLSCKASH